MTNMKDKISPSVGLISSILKPSVTSPRELRQLAVKGG